MTFKMLQELTQLTDHNNFMLDEHTILLHDAKELILTEDVPAFVTWAKSQLQRLQNLGIHDAHFKDDDMVSADEEDDKNIKDAKDAKAKLAKTLAGLLWYARPDAYKDFTPSEKSDEIGRLNHKETGVSPASGKKTHYDADVKHIGKEKLPEVIKYILDALDSKKIDANSIARIKKWLDMVNNFFLKNTPKSA